MTTDKKKRQEKKRKVEGKEEMNGKKSTLPEHMAYFHPQQN
jgi:hypothetical protein